MLRVRISRYTHSKLWYSRLVGESFVVKDYNHESYEVINYMNETHGKEGYKILKTDCKIIDDNVFINYFDSAVK